MSHVGNRAGLDSPGTVAPRRAPRRPFRLALWGALCLMTALAGCMSDLEGDHDVVRIEDRISPRDLQRFLSLIDSLPERKLPSMPSVLLPAPRWSPNRTLPVNELVSEELKLYAEHTRPDWIAAHFHQSRAFKRALRREHLTAEQFVGLALSLSTALCAEELPRDIDLEGILQRGRLALAPLRKETRVFSTLSEDTTFSILEQAAWIPIVNRAQRLKQVNQENRALVLAHRARLEGVFPSELRSDPLAPFAKVLEDQGTPFEELASSGSDDRINWSREQAIEGVDEAPLDVLPLVPAIPLVP